jgi:hypothetical protein
VDETKTGLRAVLRLVNDADTCLNNAIQEVKLRGLTRQHAWIVGAVGTARQAVRFGAKMLECAIKDPGPPKGLLS